MIDQEDLFVEGTSGYHTYRIPALVTTGTGTILAFCEGRLESRSDTGEIHILLRRSEDGGVTWGPVQIIVARSGMTCGNPAPVFNSRTGEVLLPFCMNAGDKTEDEICRGQGARTVWLTTSPDDGLTWSSPREITGSVKEPDWTWYATGPGHGIQTRSGRILIPCDHMLGKDLSPHTDPYRSHVIISDDDGATWRIGGIVAEGTNECAACELEDGTVYLSARNYHGTGTRSYTSSVDGGESFSELQWDDALPDPVCQASLVGHPNGAVLFANPASTDREKLTVRGSMDSCASWSAGIVLHAGPAAYSDLAVAPDGTVLCLYERGENSSYERITLARLPVESALNA